jgi:hypothetical protein
MSWHPGDLAWFSSAESRAILAGSGGKHNIREKTDEQAGTVSE